MKVGELTEGVEHCEREANQNSRSQQVGHSAAEAMPLRSGKRSGGPARAQREEQRQPADNGMKDTPIEPDEERSSPDEMQQRGMRGQRPFDLLEFEFVRP